MSALRLHRVYGWNVSRVNRYFKTQARLYPPSRLSNLRQEFLCLDDIIEVVNLGTCPFVFCVTKNCLAVVMLRDPKLFTVLARFCQAWRYVKFKARFKLFLDRFQKVEDYIANLGQKILVLACLNGWRDPA